MSWLSITYHSLNAATDSGLPQATSDIVSNTNRRDVSELLDLLALSETPFINRVGWGAESGGTSIEWISENLGPGYLVAAGDVATTASEFITTTIDGQSASEVAKQVYRGTVMYVFNSTDNTHAMLAAETIDTAGTMTFEWMSTSALTSYETTIEAGDKVYILGAVANEGSLPRTGKPRDREVKTNDFTILRQDVQITGSMKQTDMYAIGKEDQHQILLRLKEMQRDRERVALYSPGGITRAASNASMMKGVFGFLKAETGTHIDTSTRTLTESAMNTVVNHLWDRGATNLTFFSSIYQCAKFTQWDVNRIRTTINERRGGGHIQYWLSEAGVEVEIVPMRAVPNNIAFVLDVSRIKLRAKKGRKAIMELLGKKGDFDAWQIISEFSMEMKGYNLVQHGAFFSLS